MNIKHISLLSLFCTIGIKATLSIAERLELSKKALNECRRTSQNCELQERDYRQAMDVFQNFNARKAREINTELQNTKYRIFTKHQTEKNILLFEHDIYTDQAEFGLDSKFDDYDGSLEDFFRSIINFGCCKNNLECRAALKEASERVIQSFQEQPTE